MKSNHKNRILLAAVTLAGFAFAAPSADAATQYYNSITAANTWTGSFWGSSAAGPFTSAWVSGSDANFVDNGGIALALTGVTTNFASITADESVTVTAGGTLGTGGTVASVTVASGKTLNFQGQALSTAPGTGFIKNGLGTWSLANSNAYLGGFTLNAGTVAVGGINAMGAGGTLTINGGTIRSTATTAHDLTGKYTSITIGGDFTLGDSTNNGLLTFATTSVNLGAANRIITLNSAATFGASAVISGDAGVGFTKTGTGTLTLQGANTFSGGVTILSGTVDSKTTQTTLGSGTLVIGGTGGVNPIFQTGINNTNAVQVNANTTGTSIIAANGTGSGTVMSGAITLNSANLNVRTFSAGTTAGVTLSGGVTGTGNLTINNLSSGTAATGKVTLSGATINNLGSVTSQGTGPTANVISAVIGANVTGVVVPNTTTTPLNLTAANLYTGPTTIGTGGTLVLGNANAASNSSGVTIADTGALSLTTTPSTVKMLTFSATGTLNFNVAGGGTGLTVSTFNGVTNSGAAGSVAINITGSVPANGTYPLISYSGTLQGIGFSAYTLGTKPPGKTYALNDAAGVVELVVSDLPAKNWTGLQSTEWSTLAIAGSKNWTQGASPVDYTNGEAVLFDGTATGYTVDLSVADVAPSNIAFNNNGTTPYTLQGTKAITGDTALTKAGSQTLTILNSNTYTGATIISAGKLEIGGTSLLGALGTYAGAITIADGATFEKSASGVQTLTGAVTGLGTLKMSASAGGLTLNNPANGYKALEITAGRVFISDSALALPTAATVSITTNGLLVFNTAGTYNNVITVGNNGGICARNSAGATFSNVTLPGTGTVIFNNDDSATRLLTISKGQTLTDNLTVQISGSKMTTTTSQLGAVTLSGVLTGSGGLTLVSSGNIGNTSLYGTGTLTLTGANNYTGPTTIKSGKLVLDGATNRLAPAAAVVLGDTGTTGKLVLGSTTAASQTLTALTTTGLGGSVVGGFTTNSTLFLNIATSNTFGGTLGGVGTNENNLALTKQGAGTLTLSSAANTFTGQVLSDSGTIQVTKLENNGTASSVGSGTASLRLGSDATATLEYIGTTDSSTNKVIQIGTNAATNTGSAAILNNSASGKLTFTAATFNQVVGAATVARALTLGGTYTGAANEITGIIGDNNTAGGGIVSLTKEGASTWALSGVNTYTGATIISVGTLQIGNGSTTGSIANTSGITNNAALIYNRSNALSVGYAIGGTGTLEKQGADTLTLTGANTYTGNTSVTAGTLALADNAQLNFVLGATSGVNNGISGTGTVTLDGDFVIGTAAADALPSGTWTIVNNSTLTETYAATFTVVGFTDAGSNKWTKVNDSKLYTFDEATGILTLAAESGPGPVDHFVISAISSPQTVGTPITGITITAQDASNATATGFTGTVNFSGTGGFAGTSASFTLGVLDGPINVTPTVAGNDLTFEVDDGDSHTGSTTITTIQTQYAFWAGGAAFDADANGDGVKNGLAWILGAANPNASALGLLPAVSTSGGNMLFTFKRNQASINANTALTIDVGTTLASWPNAYNVGADTAGSTDGVTIVKDSPVSGTDTVTLTVTRSPDAKKFARLKATQNVQVP
jgi:autotransporter-associated beta strand protein